MFLFPDDARDAEGAWEPLLTARDDLGNGMVAISRRSDQLCFSLHFKAPRKEHGATAYTVHDTTSEHMHRIISCCTCLQEFHKILEKQPVL